MVRLERDYRSTPAGGVAGQPGHRRRARPDGGQQAAPGRPARPGPGAVVHRASRRGRRGRRGGRSIKKLIESGTPPSEIAVLYRINAQSEVYEEALTEAGIPFQVRGGEGFFSRQEIRQALLALQRAAERDVDDRRRAAGGRPRGCSSRSGLTAEPPAGTKARERWEALAALAELVDEEVAQRPVAGSARPGRRAAPARRRPAPTGGAGRHAGVAARREGAGVGCGVPGRAGRRHAADLARAVARPRQRARRRGAPAALRRSHKGASAFGAELGAGPGAGRPAGPTAVALPQRHRAAIAQPTPARAGREGRAAPRRAAGSATAR